MAGAPRGGSKRKSHDGSVSFASPVIRWLGISYHKSGCLSSCLLQLVMIWALLMVGGCMTWFLLQLWLTG